MVGAMASAELVLWAIRGGVKLAGQAREAYVDAARSRELTLPLPDFFPAPDLSSAVNYFAGDGKRHVASSRRLESLLSKRERGENLTEPEENELLVFHREFFLLGRAEAQRLPPAPDGSRFSAEGVNALVKVRQWQRGEDPYPTALQRVAGTIIELGIDYFTAVPGALNKETKWGQVIQSFLTGLDQIPFHEEKLGNLPARLFLAVLETVSENGDLFSGDRKVQELIKVTTKGLSADVARWIDKIRSQGGSNLALEQRAVEWTELVFRSLLTSGGRWILADPKGFLGLKEDAEAAAVTYIGGALVDLILGQKPGEIDRIFGKEGLETVMQAALKVVNEHPEILVGENRPGLSKLLTEVLTQIKSFDTLLTPGILPDLIRLVLEKTGQNLNLLWPDMANNPGKNLVLAAVRSTLEIFSRKPATGDSWTAAFTRAHLLELAELVVDQVVKNPGWAIDLSGKANSNLKIVLEAALGVLRARGDSRLSPKTAVAVLRESLKAVALRAEFLEFMPAGSAQSGKIILGAALDTVVGLVFDKSLDARVAWRMVQAEVISELVRIGLQELAASRVKPEQVAQLEKWLKAQIARISSGEGWNLEGLASDLRKELSQTQNRADGDPKAERRIGTSPGTKKKSAGHKREG